MDTDRLGRPTTSAEIRQAIDDSFKGVQGRGALLVIADDWGARATLAAKFGEHWKVAGGAGAPWGGPVTGTVAIQAVW